MIMTYCRVVRTTVQVYHQLREATTTPSSTIEHEIECRSHIIVEAHRKKNKGHVEASDREDLKMVTCSEYY